MAKKRKNSQETKEEELLRKIATMGEKEELSEQEMEELVMFAQSVVQDALNQGMDRQAIVEEMVESGWERAEATDVTNEICDNLMQGEREEQNLKKLVEATELIAVKEFPKAIELLEEIIANTPPDYSYQGVLGGKLYIKFWDRNEFLSYIEKMGDKVKQPVVWVPAIYPRAFFNLGAIYVEMGEYSKAIEFLNKGLRLEPDQPAFYTELGVAYGALKDYEQSIFNCRKALTVRKYCSDHVLAVAYRGLGINLIDLNQLDEAEEALKQSLIIEPDHPLALQELEVIGRLRRKEQIKPVSLGILEETLGSTQRIIQKLQERGIEIKDEYTDEEAEEVEAQKNLVAHSELEEFLYILRQRCTCGGELEEKRTIFVAEIKPSHLVVTQCRDCKKQTRFIFDISYFDVEEWKSLDPLKINHTNDPSEIIDLVTYQKLAELRYQTLRKHISSMGQEDRNHFAKLAYECSNEALKFFKHGTPIEERRMLFSKDSQRDYLLHRDYFSFENLAHFNQVTKEYLQNLETIAEVNSGLTGNAEEDKAYLVEIINSFKENEAVVREIGRLIYDTLSDEEIKEWEEIIDKPTLM